MEKLFVLVALGLGLACVAGALIGALRAAPRVPRCRACRRELVVQGFQCAACGADLRASGIIPVNEGSPRVALAGLLVLGMLPLGCLGTGWASSWGPARVRISSDVSLQSPRSKAYQAIRVHCTVDRRTWDRSVPPTSLPTQRVELTLKAAGGTHTLRADFESGEFNYLDSQGAQREGSGLSQQTVKQWLLDVGIVANDPAALDVEIADVWAVMVNRNVAATKGFDGQTRGGMATVRAELWFMLLVVGFFLALGALGIRRVLTAGTCAIARRRSAPGGVEGDEGAQAVSERSG